MGTAIIPIMTELNRLGTVNDDNMSPRTQHLDRRNLWGFALAGVSVIATPVILAVTGWPPFVVFLGLVMCSALAVSAFMNLYR